MTLTIAFMQAQPMVMPAMPPVGYVPSIGMMQVRMYFNAHTSYGHLQNNIYMTYFQICFSGADAMPGTNSDANTNVGVATSGV
jgi:hypothetical protein